MTGSATSGEDPAYRSAHPGYVLSGRRGRDIGNAAHDGDELDRIGQHAAPMQPPQAAHGIGVGLIAAFAFWARGWFLRQWDAQLSARDAGDAAAVRRLRRLHWGGMLANAILLFAIVGSVPYVAATAA